MINVLQDETTYDVSTASAAMTNQKARAQSALEAEKTLYLSREQYWIYAKLPLNTFGPG